MEADANRLVLALITSCVAYTFPYLTLNLENESSCMHSFAGQ